MSAPELRGTSATHATENEGFTLRPASDADIPALELLIAAPEATFVPALSPASADWHPRPAPGISWAQGFLRALELGLQGLKGRSAGAQSAAGRIARYASAPTIVPSSHGAIAADLAEAVLILAAERTSRGPLGPLPMTNRSKRAHPPVGLGTRDLLPPR